MWNFAHERCSRCVDLESKGDLMPEGTLNKKVIPPLTSRVDKIDAPFTAPGIKAQLDAILELGWNLNGIYFINGDEYAVFTRPKRQP